MLGRFGVIGGRIVSISTALNTMALQQFLRSFSTTLPRFTSHNNEPNAGAGAPRDQEENTFVAEEGNPKWVLEAMGVMPDCTNSQESGSEISTLATEIEAAQNAYYNYEQALEGHVIEFFGVDATHPDYHGLRELAKRNIDRGYVILTTPPPTDEQMELLQAHGLLPKELCSPGTLQTFSEAASDASDKITEEDEIEAEAFSDRNNPEYPEIVANARIPEHMKPKLWEGIKEAEEYYAGWKKMLEEPSIEEHPDIPGLMVIRYYKTIAERITQQYEALYGSKTYEPANGNFEEVPLSEPLGDTATYSEDEAARSEPLGDVHPTEPER